jgi:hypothetical protein
LKSLNHHRIPSLSRVRISADERAIVLRGEVNSFYARQLLVHGAIREAAGREVIDEVFVVPPSALRDPLALGRVAAAGLALLVLVVLSGCGSSQSERVPVHPVSGQVHFNGKPAAGAHVVFHPKQPLPGAPSPHGHVDAQGNFVLSTYSANDGAPAGEYSVTVVLEKMVKKGEDFVPGPNLLPPKYAGPQTTKVVALVAEGPNTVPIKLVR